MINSIPIREGRAVFGKDEFTYQSVLDDFKTAQFIGIMTFNISRQTDSRLLSELKKACNNGTNAVIITNVPKRFPSYYGKKYESDAKNMIDLYVKQLDPKKYAMRLSPYFTFKNHAKIIMTDNMVYWGSGNFSDESSENLECGTISTDSELIKYLKESLFATVQENSVPYFKYNFAEAIANLNDLIPICENAKEKLFEAAFEPWSEYETHFEEKWVYRTNGNEISVSFLRGIINRFNQFEDALNVIDTIIEDYAELEELPDQVERLQVLFEEYKKTFENFINAISSLFYDLEEMAQYDVSKEACKIIEKEYSMEAYDENLDKYAEKAINEADSEYRKLIMDSEPIVKDALESLDSILEYLDQLKSSLLSLLVVDPRINNTGL